MKQTLKLVFDDSLSSVAQVEIQADTLEKQNELEQLAVRFLESLSKTADDAN